MSDYSSLKATINANVKANNNHEITGSIMNSVLNAMVNSLGAGYQFIGVATPTTPGSAQTPDYKCFYLATTPGTYTNLGGLVVANGEVALLKWDTSWTKQVTGIASLEQLDDLAQTLSESLSYVISEAYAPSNFSGTSRSIGAVFYVTPEIQSILRRKPLVGVELIFATTGTFSICKGKNIGLSSYTYEVIETFNISRVGRQKVLFSNEIQLAEDECIGIANDSDSAFFYFGGSNGNEGYRFLYNGAWSYQDNGNLQVSFLKKGSILSDPHVGEICLFSPNTFEKSRQSIPTQSPFWLIEAFQKSCRSRAITGIKLNVVVPGSLTIVKTSENPIGVASVNYTIVKIFDVEKTGIQILYFDFPVVLADDEWIGIDVPTDTAQFAYDVSSAPNPDKNNIPYILGGTIYDNDLNVAILAQNINAYDGLVGKKLTIIGDSISTYAGYLPTADYEYFYPQGNIDNVLHTWWKILCKRTGMVIEYNNSWSSSCVCSNDSPAERSAISDYRFQYIGSPDVVIVEMGVNDYRTQKQIGAIDKSGQNLDTTTFAGAYQTLIVKLQKAAPKAKIILCTMVQMARYSGSDGSHTYPMQLGGQYLADFAQVIRDLADLYGCELLDLWKCGITYYNSNNSPSSVGMTENLYTTDGVHPNREGQMMIENQIENKIRELFK